MEAINGTLFLDADEAERWGRDRALRDTAARIFEECGTDVGAVYDRQRYLVDAWVRNGWHRGPARQRGELRRRWLDARSQLVSLLQVELGHWANLAIGLGELNRLLDAGEIGAMRDRVDDLLDLEYELTGDCKILADIDEELGRLGFPSRVELELKGEK